MTKIAAIAALLLFANPAFAQNEYAVRAEWQFAPANNFGEQVNGSLYGLEFQYGRMFPKRKVIISYVAETSWSSVKDSKGIRADGIEFAPVGMRLRFSISSKAQPFLESEEGFLVFDKKMFDAGRFNFTAQFGGGIRFPISTKTAIELGYKYHHISNANLYNQNLGMGSHTVFIGIVF